MEKFIVSETDEELKKAYSEMREGCLAHPGDWGWYAMWMIEKPDGTHIGDLCFKGIEAVKLALKWAFEHPQVLAVEAESDPDNAAFQRVLEKCGFLATGAIGEEGPRFIVYKGANRPVDDCSAPTGVERRNNKQ